MHQLDGDGADDDADEPVVVEKNCRLKREDPSFSTLPMLKLPVWWMLRAAHCLSLAFYSDDWCEDGSVQPERKQKMKPQSITILFCWLLMANCQLALIDPNCWSLPPSCRAVEPFTLATTNKPNKPKKKNNSKKSQQIVIQFFRWHSMNKRWEQLLNEIGVRGAREIVETIFEKIE